MFEPSAMPRVFTIPPGCDFSRLFVAGLESRLAGAPPEALARVEIIVNTERTRRRLVDLLLAGPPRLLPRIRTLAELGTDAAIMPGIPPAAPALQRLMELSRLVAAMIDAAPETAPRASVFDLAASLGRLMDEMQAEGVAPAVFETLVEGDHAGHWQRSLEFLNLLRPYFESGAPPSADGRRRMVVAALVERWRASPPSHPVIVAGSTGSRDATARLIAAIARLPQGAVVLPGLDTDLPEAAQQALADPGRSGDHPQAALVRLVSGLGLSIGAIPGWSADSAPHPACNRLVSLALRPAPVTDQWLSEGPRHRDPAATTAHLSLIEAPDVRAEATAIACRLRAAVAEGKRAALVTPDRALARRVAAALGRWKLRPDDSAGQPLSLAPRGVFLRLAAVVLGERLTAEHLVAILKHPLTHGGAGRNTHLLRVRDLELEHLRGGRPFPDFAAIGDWAERRERDAGAQRWAAWLEATLNEDPLGGRVPIETLIDRHRRIAETLAAGPDGTAEGLFDGEEGEAVARLLHDLRGAADAAPFVTAADYARLVAMLLGERELRPAAIADWRIAILGTLESRVQSADLVILGGLNEGVWPPVPAPDPWLSRDMRGRAGLLLPERRIGLSAHDFQQAVAAPEVVLSRALRDADAPTVASRWLVRIEGLLAGLGTGGAAALGGMRARGTRWLDLARRAETPVAPLPPTPRPAPRPPVAHRPRRLSVTRIKTLICDPYAVYARDILRLKPLDALRETPDALTRGTAIHDVLERFVEETRDSLPADAAAVLSGIAAEVFGAAAPWPAARRQWQARLDRIAGDFIAGERLRRETARPGVLETKGRLVFGEPPFELVCKADRIDMTAAGEAVIYDYKSGAVPKKSDIETCDHQLALEGAILQAGGFEGVPATAVAELAYIGVGSEAVERPLSDPGALIDAARAGLGVLLGHYRNRQTGYIAHAWPKAKVGDDYDHLARYGEWSVADAPEPEDVG